jgi:hypothetical protein
LRVAAECVAVTAQGGATAAAETQSCAARGSGAALTTHADTAERTRHVRSGSTVQCSTFTGDQAGLAA